MFRRLTSGLVGGFAAASAVAVLSVPVPATPAAAVAASVPPKSLKGDVSSYALAATQADMLKVASYWSPDRLKRASSYEPKTKPSPTASATTSAAELGKASAPLRAPAIAPTPDAPPMVGKVFFKVDDKEYWCSASAVHSAYKNLVATAGHCTYSLARDKPVENWIFIPSYANGATSAGIFVGHTLYMHQDFQGQGDFDRDYAFVTVYPGFTWQPYTEAGKVKYRSASVGPLEDRVGAFRFAWNKGSGLNVRVFGYPAGAHPDGSRPYNGQELKTCSNATEKKTVSAPTWQLEHGVRLAGCGFTSGASGGPWVIGYDSAKHTGWINGVTSLTWNLNGDGKVDAVSTPYFNTIAQRVYLQAARQATS
ncbi:trypsin-like serine peptidase [Microtetraspora malaysiensis]|uniref:Trypsin-like serine peptidase n=1 Tax=Microtetraspora malaysiensis TaxID=161358 RepID=A0ABW6SW54_9ACTN